MIFARETVFGRACGFTGVCLRICLAFGHEKTVVSSTSAFIHVGYLVMSTNVQCLCVQVMLYTRRMHVLLARYAVVPTAMSRSCRTGAKLCSLIIKLEIVVWHNYMYNVCVYR